MTDALSGSPVAVRADPTLRRLGEGVWIGGSPLVLFRLTGAGDELVGRLAGADPAVGLTVNGRVARSLLDRLAMAGAAHPLPGAGPGAPGPGEVTVVVPVRDREGPLEELLAGLAAGPGAPGELLVVDDGSLDPAAVRRIADDHGARLVRNDTPRGPATARNLGLAEVRTPLVAFVDSDVSVAAGWLAPLLDQLRDARVAMVAPRIRSSPGGTRLERYERGHSPLDLGVESALVRQRARVSYVPAAALVARTGVLRALGGFDESMRYGEDVDLVWRAVAAGHLVRYEPASVVLHAPRPTWRAWAAQRVAYGSSASVLAGRHGAAVAPVVCSGWSATTWLLAASGHPVGGALVAGGSAVALARKLESVPPMNSLALATSGHLAAGRQLARAVLRPWWPLALAGSILSRRLRRVVATAVLADLAARPGGVPERCTSVADDLAYGMGVWAGVLRTRRPGALLPALGRWP